MTRIRQIADADFIQREASAAAELTLKLQTQARVLHWVEQLFLDLRGEENSTHTRRVAGSSRISASAINVDIPHLRPGFRLDVPVLHSTCTDTMRRKCSFTKAVSLESNAAFATMSDKSAR